MNKRSILALAALLLLAAVLLLGLPFTSHRMIARQMTQMVQETATPMPNDGIEGDAAHLQIENNSLTT